MRILICLSIESDILETWQFRFLRKNIVATLAMASDGAEVAEDYRLALEDLSSNARFEISNLTLIARENTEHALAIAEVLQRHILKVWSLWISAGGSSWPRLPLLARHRKPRTTC